ncbi:hypothetical protein KC725_05840 [Candidatus Peregrinibacteria bacterium]|nr:hypothetical protein [Candidatus Peregrinibacteria bacterium]
MEKNKNLSEATKEDQQKEQKFEILGRERETIGDALKRAIESKKQKIRIESYTPETITPQIVEQLADAFRYTFNNVFPEFVLCQSCETQASAGDVFGSEGREVTLKEMDQLQHLPCCGRCGEEMELFHDPEKTKYKLQEKLKGNACVTILSDPTTGEIIGFSIGYEETLQTIFKNEWSYRYTYTKDQREDRKRDFSTFVKAVQEEYKNIEIPDGVLKEDKVGPNTKAYCLACVVLTPNFRGSGSLLKLLKEFFRSIPEDTRRERVVMSELIQGSKSYNIMRQKCPHEIKDFLGEELVILMGSLQKLADRFLKK